MQVSYSKYVIASISVLIWIKLGEQGIPMRAKQHLG